jgi:hypothetical protein
MTSSCAFFCFSLTTQISSRRAAVLAYITNQLLRTVAAIDRENEAQVESPAPRTIIFDMPRPQYENAVFQKPLVPAESTS